MPYQRTLPKWAHPRPRDAERPSRDWWKYFLAAVPGIAALIGVVPSYLSASTSNHQLQINERAQVASELDTDTADLDSHSTVRRISMRTPRSWRTTSKPP